MIKLIDLEDDYKVQVIEWGLLPFTEMLFIKKGEFVVAGYNKAVYKFKFDEEEKEW